MNLFNENIRVVPQTGGLSDAKKMFNGNMVAVTAVIFCFVFFWYKYNQKKRRLLVEAQARAQRQLARQEEAKRNMHLQSMYTRQEVAQEQAPVQPTKPLSRMQPLPAASSFRF